MSQAPNFPFLTYEENLSNRTTYYSTLGRILVSGDNIEKFDTFMEPFGQTCTMLLQTPHENFRKSDCKKCLIGLFRDLRGVVFACNHKPMYLRFFEWMCVLVVVVVPTHRHSMNPRR